MFITLHDYETWWDPTVYLKEGVKAFFQISLLRVLLETPSMGWQSFIPQCFCYRRVTLIIHQTSIKKTNLLDIHKNWHYTNNQNQSKSNQPKSINQSIN